MSRRLNCATKKSVKMRLIVTILLCCLLVISESSPILLDKLFGFSAYQPAYSGYGANNNFGYYGGGGGGYIPNQVTSPPVKRENRGRSYKDICRVVNPTQYAMGKLTAPFCPY